MHNSKTTFVLVHGAWAECASWTKVIVPLQKQGFDVVCAPIPLTTLSDDVGALDRVLARIGGDIVLVGHAYAGAVIGATKKERVKSLVYVAALGHVWGPNKERGLFKTIDGGKTWTASKFIDEDTGFIDLAMDSSEPDTLYAAAYCVRRDGFSGGNPAVQTGPGAGFG